MRILVAHNRYTAPGGEDTVFAAEVALLEANGHKVITFEEHNKRIDAMNPVAVAAKSIWSLESKRKFRSIIADEKPDIAHFHNTFPLISPSAYYACAQAGVPVIQTLHNYRLVCPGPYLLRNGAICEKCVGKRFAWPAIVHACYQTSSLRSANVAIMLTLHRMLKTWQNTVTRYIATSQFARDKFIEGGLPADKIFVKPNFVNDGPTGQQSGNAKYFLFIGRLSEEKGIAVLIDAMTRARHVPIKIIGDGPLAGAIDEQIQRHGLTQVERLGQLPSADVLQHLQSAACLVAPSICYETFGMTIVEAYSRSVPVIASRSGSMAEIVENHVTGLQFASGNAAELAERINWAWSNQEPLRKMGQNAYQRYTEKYTASQNYEMLMAIYKEVLAREK